jgi:predicted secreted protein
MTPLSGKNGKITVQSGVGAAVSHRLKEWSMPIKADILDGTAFGATADLDGNVWREKYAGLVGGSVSVSGVWDADNNPVAAAAFRPGLTVALKLYVRDTDIHFDCAAIVEEANPNVKVEGEAGFQASLQVTGPVTFPA